MQGRSFFSMHLFITIRKRLVENLAEEVKFPFVGNHAFEYRDKPILVGQLDLGTTTIRSKEPNHLM